MTLDVQDIENKVFMALLAGARGAHPKQFYKIPQKVRGFLHSLGVWSWDVRWG